MDKTLCGKFSLYDVIMLLNLATDNYLHKYFVLYRPLCFLSHDILPRRNVPRKAVEWGSLEQPL